jgi:hypothetical protein
MSGMQQSGTTPLGMGLFERKNEFDEWEAQKNAPCGARKRIGRLIPKDFRPYLFVRRFSFRASFRTDGYHADSVSGGDV